MLMAGTNSYSDTSSLLHQLETELKRDMNFSPPSGARYPRGEPYIQKEQCSGDSTSFPRPKILSATTYRESPPPSSVFGNHLQRLPPLHQALGTNPLNTLPPTTYSLPDDNQRGDCEISEKINKSITPQAHQTPSSPSPRRRTPSIIGRSASTGSGRLESRGRITKVHRTERPNIEEERSWFDAEGDLGKSVPAKGPAPRPIIPVIEIKRKEVPYRVQNVPKNHHQENTAFRIEDQVADILSTFDATPNTQTSSSHSSDLHNPLDDIHLASLLNCPTAPSLPATIYSLAVSNPSFFQILRQAVPPEYCAISFFKRIEAQVYAICRRHSDYLFSGASMFDFTGKAEHSSSYGKMLAEDEEMCVPDAKWCEAALKRRVNTIRRHLEMRKPLGKEAGEQAMRVLVRILWEVTDKGGYEENGIVGGTMPVEPASDQHGSRRNAQHQNMNIGLYGRLIGAAGVSVAGSRRSGGFQGAVPMPFGCWSLPPSAGHTGNDDGFFVIEAMWDLVDCADVCLDQLTKISTRIRTYGAREGYIEELGRFLTEARKRREHNMVPSADIGMNEEEAVLSRRSSVDSTKRARRPSREEMAGEQDRAAFRRRVS